MQGVDYRGKYIDTYDSGFNIIADTTASSSIITNSLLLCATGTGATERDGKRIRLKGVSLKFTLRLASANPTYLEGQCMARVCLMVDHQPNGAAPDPSDMFEADNFLLTLCVPLKNHVRKRFTILRTWVVQLDPQCNTGVWWNNVYAYQDQKNFKYSAVEHIDEYVNLEGEVIEYKDNTSNITSLEDKNLFLWGVSSSINTPVNMAYWSRVRFYG